MAAPPDMSVQVISPGYICTISRYVKVAENTPDAVVKTNSAGDKVYLMEKVLYLENVTRITDSLSVRLSDCNVLVKPVRDRYVVDLGNEGSLSLTFARACPFPYDDASKDSRKWSNRKWITEFREFFDVWQNELYDGSGERTGGYTLAFTPAAEYSPLYRTIRRNVFLAGNADISYGTSVTRVTLRFKTASMLLSGELKREIDNLIQRYTMRMWKDDASYGGNGSGTPVGTRVRVLYAPATLPSFPDFDTGQGNDPAADVLTPYRWILWKVAGVIKPAWDSTGPMYPRTRLGTGTADASGYILEDADGSRYMDMRPTYRKREKCVCLGLVTGVLTSSDPSDVKEFAGASGTNYTESETGPPGYGGCTGYRFWEYDGYDPYDSFADEGVKAFTMKLAEGDYEVVVIGGGGGAGYSDAGVTYETVKDMGTWKVHYNEWEELGAGGEGGTTSSITISIPEGGADVRIEYVLGRGGICGYTGSGSAEQISSEYCGGTTQVTVAGKDDTGKVYGYVYAEGGRAGGKTPGGLSGSVRRGGDVSVTQSAGVYAVFDEGGMDRALLRSGNSEQDLNIPHRQYANKASFGSGYCTGTDHRGSPGTASARGAGGGCAPFVADCGGVRFISQGGDVYGAGVPGEYETPPYIDPRYAPLKDAKDKYGPYNSVRVDPALFYRMDDYSISGYIATYYGRDCNGALARTRDYLIKVCGIAYSDRADVMRADAYWKADGRLMGTMEGSWYMYAEAEMASCCGVIGGGGGSHAFFGTSYGKVSDYEGGRDEIRQNLACHGGTGAFAIFKLGDEQ